MLLPAPARFPPGSDVADQSKLYDNPRSPKKDKRDFTDRFNTKLTDKEEAAYQKWAAENGRQNDAYDYDMRGAWKEGVDQSENGHFPDTYKKPNHPTFSDESKYSDKDNKGGKWSKKGDKDVFTPSDTNLKHYKADELRNYFQTVEPTADLALPDE